MVPQRFYVNCTAHRRVYASRTRFIPDTFARHFEARAWPVATGLGKCRSGQGPAIHIAARTAPGTSRNAAGVRVDSPTRCGRTCAVRAHLTVATRSWASRMPRWCGRRWLNTWPCRGRRPTTAAGGDATGNSWSEPTICGKAISGRVQEGQPLKVSRRTSKRAHSCRQRSRGWQPPGREQRHPEHCVSIADGSRSLREPPYFAAAIDDDGIDALVRPLRWQFERLGRARGRCLRRNGVACQASSDLIGPGRLCRRLAATGGRPRLGPTADNAFTRSNASTPAWRRWMGKGYARRPLATGPGAAMVHALCAGSGAQ